MGLFLWLKETRKVWYLHKMSSSKEDKQVCGANLEGNGENFLNGFQAYTLSVQLVNHQNTWALWCARWGRRPFTALKGVGAACQVGAPSLQSCKIHTYFKIPHHSASIFSSLDEMYDMATFEVAISYIRLLCCEIKLK